MRRNTFIACAGILALALGGCATGPETTTEVSPAPDAAASPVAVVPAASPAAQPFAQPTVTASPTGTLPPDLISSTDPNQRVREIDSNRADPFALVPTRPIVEAIPVAQAPQSVPTLPSLPNNAPNPGNRPPVPSTPSGTLTPLPTLPSGVPLPPPPPQPDLARQVAVTGVVQIGNTVHAIVKAPNEPTSRYVRVGQSLSNGQVLVKRIEMNPGGDPVVVLEQYGIEVVVAVGEGGPPAEGTPTAAIPQPRA